MSTDSLFDCMHVDTLLRRRSVANKGIQYWHQCTRCGKAVGQAVSHRDPAVMRLTVRDEWDYALQARVEQAYAEHWRAKREQADEQREMRRIEYDRYLTTPEWRAKRKAVLERDNYRCQGCLSARATQVHHLTYAHVGHELLFELVSICDACHETAHSGAQEAASR